MMKDDDEMIKLLEYLAHQYGYLFNLYIVLKDGYRDMLDSIMDKTGCLTPDDVVNKFQQLEKENKVLREDSS